MSASGSGQETPQGGPPERIDVPPPTDPNTSALAFGLSPTTGASASVAGPGAPSRHMKLILPPALSVLGLPVAVVVLLGDKSLWLVVAGFAIPQLMAVFWWQVLSRMDVGQSQDK